MEHLLGFCCALFSTRVPFSEDVLNVVKADTTVLISFVSYEICLQGHSWFYPTFEVTLLYTNWHKIRYYIYVTCSDSCEVWIVILSAVCALFIRKARQRNIRISWYLHSFGHFTLQSFQILYIYYIKLKNIYCGETCMSAGLASFKCWRSVDCLRMAEASLMNTLQWMTTIKLENIRSKMLTAWET
jgi:hypothetical protein